MASSFQGVDINPVNLKNGSLFAALNPTTSPGTSGYGAVVQTGTAKVGTALYGGRGSAENSAAPRPLDGGGQPRISENPDTLAGQTEAGRGLTGL